MISTDGKPKTARSIHYTDDLIKKLKTPKRGRGAPRRETAKSESSEEVHPKRTNRSMTAAQRRSMSFMVPTAASKKKKVEVKAVKKQP